MRLSWRAILQQVDVDTPRIQWLIHLRVHLFLQAGNEVTPQLLQLVLCIDTAVLRELI